MCEKYREAQIKGVCVCVCVCVLHAMQELCKAAALGPIRDRIDEDKAHARPVLAMRGRTANGEAASQPLRPLSRADFVGAMEQVRATARPETR